MPALKLQRVALQRREREEAAERFAAENPDEQER